MVNTTGSGKGRKTRYVQVQVPEMDRTGHKQPQNLEMEVAVIGALMAEQDSYAQVAELLSPECFYDPRHQAIYQAIAELKSQDMPVDIMTVQEQLDSTGMLEHAGGSPYLLEINSRIASSAHIEYHAKIIAQKYMARRLITFSSDIQTKAFDTTMDVETLMQDAESQLFELSKKTLKKDFTQINPIINCVFEKIKLASNKKDGLSGLPTGFEELDKMTSGWQASDLIIIAARPAMGKTAFALSMIKRMAVDYKKPCAIFSLEMSNEQLVQRLMVNVSELSGEKLRSGKLETFEWGQLDAKVKQLENAPIFLDDTPSLTVFELQTKARRLKSEYNVECIMIDYLQLMHASGTNINSRQEEVSSISRSLKSLAKELEIPIIALSQLNRGVETREGGIENKRPQLSDLRESGAIEQDADIVCFIHRPEYYKLTIDETGYDWRGKALFIIAKHRNGSVGDIKLEFKAEYARFADLNTDAPMPGENVSRMGGRYASAPVSSERISESNYSSDLSNEIYDSPDEEDFDF